MQLRNKESCAMSGSDRRYLFDTNAVVALFRGNAFLQNLAHETEWLGISIITQLEFLSFPGLTESDELLFSRFAERVETVNLDAQRPDLVSSVIQLRKIGKLKLPDAIVAASALIQSATLVTADRDFLRAAQHVPKLILLEFPNP